MLRRLLKSDALRDSTLLVVVAAIWVFFQIATEGTFLSQRNLVLLALQTSIVSLAAISAVMLNVTRNFDLSGGSHLDNVRESIMTYLKRLSSPRYDLICPWGRPSRSWASSLPS